MNCPNCGSSETQWKKGWVFFRRRCTACQHKWIDIDETERNHPSDRKEQARWKAQFEAEDQTGWQS